MAWNVLKLAQPYIDTFNAKYGNKSFIADWTKAADPVYGGAAALIAFSQGYTPQHYADYDPAFGEVIGREIAAAQAREHDATSFTGKASALVGHVAPIGIAAAFVYAGAVAAGAVGAGSAAAEGGAIGGAAAEGGSVAVGAGSYAAEEEAGIYLATEETVAAPTWYSSALTAAEKYAPSIGKAGLSLLSSKLTGGSKQPGTGAIPQQNIGHSAGNAGYIYPRGGPYYDSNGGYLPALDFGSGGDTSGGSGSASFGLSAGNLAAIFVAIVGVIVLSLLARR
jgi:hypothetical protein